MILFYLTTRAAVCLHGSNTQYVSTGSSAKKQAWWHVNDNHEDYDGDTDAYTDQDVAYAAAEDDNSDSTMTLK